MIEIREKLVTVRRHSAIRRTIDIVVAVLALAVLAVPMLLISVLIRVSSPGPALLRQRRVGHGEIPFTCYKFRTMRLGGSDAAHRELIARELRGEPASVGGSYKLYLDPRVTRAGSWLRRTSIDELPQLINILRGDMTFVGPRPCLSWEAEMFPAEYTERFTVRPGMTGLWQVSGRSTLGTREMLELDVLYVHQRSLWRDLCILLRTIPSMLRQDGSR
jgi:lipopolysaccharide/colanic/teichoic acid biosynthesis glycosyltransferase